VSQRRSMALLQFVAVDGQKHRVRTAPMRSLDFMLYLEPPATRRLHRRWPGIPHSTALAMVGAKFAPSTISLVIFAPDDDRVRAPPPPLTIMINRLRTVAMLQRPRTASVSCTISGRVKCAAIHCAASTGWPAVPGPPAPSAQGKSRRSPATNISPPAHDPFPPDDSAGPC
jgi:hypothetical protein